ncbi:hypothetical protein DW927_12185 [Roseburia intestinalis]|uniref:Uncharacterized protein n=1 Tax=Roseburia intestinalis TaxID=166486 RepID=A0A3R6A774_9FIRM|nr:hypothetical protein DW927_12185 [Roseburia intestinalis]
MGQFYRFPKEDLGVHLPIGEISQDGFRQQLYIDMEQVLCQKFLLVAVPRQTCAGIWKYLIAE